MGLYWQREGVVVLRQIEKDGLLRAAKKERLHPTRGVVDMNVVLNNREGTIIFRECFHKEILL